MKEIKQRPVSPKSPSPSIPKNDQNTPKSRSPPNPKNSQGTPKSRSPPNPKNSQGTPKSRQPPSPKNSQRTPKSRSPSNPKYKVKTSPISPPSPIIDRESVNVDFSLMDDSFHSVGDVEGIPLSTPNTPKLVMKSPSRTIPNVKCENSFSPLMNEDEIENEDTGDAAGEGEMEVKTVERCEEKVIVFLSYFIIIIIIIIIIIKIIIVIIGGW